MALWIMAILQIQTNDTSMIYRKRLLSFLVILVYLNIGWANDRNYEKMSIDELKEKLKETIIETDKYTYLYHLTFKYARADFDSAMFYGNRYLEMATINNNPREIAKANLRIGAAQMQYGKTTPARKRLQAAFEGFTLISDEKNAAKCMINIGLGYVVEEEHQLALSTLLNALELEENLQPIDTMTLIALHINLAAAFERVKKLEPALEQLKKAEQVLALADVPRLTAKVLINKANILIKQQKIETAIPFILKAIKTVEPTNNLSAKAIYTYNLGIAYQQIKKYEQAIKPLKESIVLFEKSGYESALWSGYYSLANCYLETGKIDSAYEIALKGTSLAPKTKKFRTLLADNYSLLSHIDSIKGNYQLALHHYKEFSILKDSVKAINYNAEIEKISSRFELKEKEKEVITLQQTEQIQQLEINQQQKLIQYGIFGLIGLGVLSFLLFRLNRLKQKHNQELAQQNKQIEQQNALINQSLKEKELLLNEVYHRTKNNLTLVENLLGLASNRLKENTAKIALVESKNRVQSIALIHQMLHQQETKDGTRIDVRGYVASIVQSLSTSSIALPQSGIHISQSIAPLSIDIELLIPLGLIINESITNAIKHAFPFNQVHKTILVSLEEIKFSQLKLTIADNGENAKADLFEMDNDGFGINLINGLAEQIDAELSNFINQGTTIELIINYDKYGVINEGSFQSFTVDKAYSKN